ncbi:uncharacterized protein CLUP02_14090 [Colletotrichum lupini]|uniref:Uncharacterized protein n=1 Tax=Colletotrichum lupini TaxID=145971 RepID=A0A9Q8WMZ1_9PEZI|nr:uncharacterized protein CLUP02_14090 [Colletotrichum lupini]UQC88565.1 hypothetical protein CLUP02_14090 [Colletotrichum lupini]
MGYAGKATWRMKYCLSKDLRSILVQEGVSPSSEPGAPSRHPPQTGLWKAFHTADNMTCESGFEGNSDIYGLGVRIGVYLQWCTSILAQNFYEPAVEGMQDANSTYQLAMTCGFMFITSRPSEGLKTIEGYIALLFCFAGACISSLQNRSAFSTVLSKNGVGEPPRRRVRTAGDMLLNAIISSYGIWFLFIGIGKLERTVCQERAFFFTSVALFGWFRFFLSAGFILGLLVSTLLLVAQAIILISWVSNSLDNNINMNQRIFGGVNDPTPNSTRQNQRVDVTISTGQLFGSMLALGLFIAAVEETLDWNNISGVHQCADFSQLFPLMIGATNFARVAAQFLLDHGKGKIALKPSKLTGMTTNNIMEHLKLMPVRCTRSA